MFDLPIWVFRAAWAFWGAWFIVWEALAVIDKGENETLSGTLKALMWQDNGRPTVVAFIVAPVLAWLLWHFYIEIKNNWTT